MSPSTLAPRGTTTLWATRLWVGKLGAMIKDGFPALLEDSGALMTAHAPESVLADSRQVLCDVRDVLAALLADSGSPVSGLTEVDLRVETWTPGYAVGLAYGTGAWNAWCFLDSTEEVRDPESGGLSLHDPRAGCASVTVPGLPWGRPMKIAPKPGLAVIHPGWLGYSILPVRAGHRLAVLKVTLSNREPQ